MATARVKLISVMRSAHSSGVVLNNIYISLLTKLRDDHSVDATYMWFMPGVKVTMPQQYKNGNSPFHPRRRMVAHGGAWWRFEASC